MNSELSIPQQKKGEETTKKRGRKKVAMKEMAIAVPSSMSETSPQAHDITSNSVEMPSQLNVNSITDPQQVQNIIENKYKTCYPPEKCFGVQNMFSEIIDNREMYSIIEHLFSLGTYTEDMKKSILYYGSVQGYGDIQRYIYSKTGERYPGINHFSLSSAERIRVKNHIVNIDNAFRTSAPRYNDTIVTFRGTKRPFKYLNNIGDMQETPTYTSTSRSFDIAMKFSEITEKGFIDDACCLYIYLISPGIPYIDFLANRLGIQYEIEILLPRNLVFKYEGDVLLDTTKINFNTRNEEHDLQMSKFNELNQKVLNGEITEKEGLKQYQEFVDNNKGLHFKDTECISDLGEQIRQLQKEADNLAIINQLDLSRLAEPVKRTLSSRLMHKFQGIRDLLMPRIEHRDPVNMLTTEGKYKIKVLSVHAKQDNIYNIQPSADLGINNNIVNKSNIGGKRKTKRRRQPKKRSKRRK